MEEDGMREARFAQHSKVPTEGRTSDVAMEALTPSRLNACPTKPGRNATSPCGVPSLWRKKSRASPSPGHQLTMPAGRGIQVPCAPAFPTMGRINIAINHINDKSLVRIVVLLTAISFVAIR
jgi:hypothetical protein